jgi:N-acyl homoserine lactone hydrolase
VRFEVLRLHLATVRFPAQHPLAGQQGEVFGFVLRGDSAVVLFDTGLGVGHPRIDELYQPVVHAIDEALAGHGLSPGDVTAVVNSHLHFDHCGQNGRFPGVPIHVQRTEYEATERPNYTALEWVDFPGATYELHDGEAEPVDGIRLLPTPGHTPGHQSAVVDTAQGAVVLAGQACYTAAEWAGSDAPDVSGLPSAWDRQRYEDSRARLHQLEATEVLFAHDRRSSRS